ncbi:MAG TPA: glycosyltransferase family 2 protein [Candidatus Diapherotrites archaeon]|uniref:Glycosyltransferase family 2 protein n=1 Tax=Candidatus Iainarchaeum sp. TaxID=3101447 RepID=A0A7J4IZK7_9ARCH|nr:glycosyltransferase family 2 protein [Candidatus Diapherotrites archaeon]
MKLVVTIPAFNEEKTIGEVIRGIPAKIPGVGSIEVLVVDDGSTDSTAQRAEKAGARVLVNKANCGLAFTFSRGMNGALEMGADIIVNTDADNQYDQSQIPVLVRPILEGKSDVVLGSRFLGKIEEMPLGKRLGNMAVSWLMRLLTGLPLTDTQTGFRAFSREAALHINVLSDYTYTQETVLEAAEKKLSVTEVPVDFRKRADGSRLISNIFVYAKRVGFTLIETYINYRPLKVFFASGSLLLLAGAAFGLRVLVHYARTGSVSPYLPSAVLSALLLIFGFQVMVAGITAELIKRNRKISEERLYLEKRLILEARGKARRF